MTPLLLFAAVGIIATIAFLFRQTAAAAIERSVDGRHPRGPDGITHGAEAITLEGGSRAVLLLHGFGDTPQSMRALAEHLHERGWTVRVPLLPGHGRVLRAFARSRAVEWIATARSALAELRGEGRTVALVGQSVGGALAVLIAAEANDVPAAVLLAPYLTMPPGLARLARYHRIVWLAARYLNSRAEGSIRDPEARGRSLGYGVTPARSLGELGLVTWMAWVAAPRVRTPTLVVQSRDDPRIQAHDAERSFQRLGTSEKELLWTKGNGHVISVDSGRDEVFAQTVSWLERLVVSRRD